MAISRFIRRRCWDLHRFGLSPAKLLDRLHSSAESKIVTISMPKAGTHLLERILCLFPGYYRQLRRQVHMGNIDDFGGLQSLLPTLRNGQILSTHLAYTPEHMDTLQRGGVRSIFLYRDPRDIVVSEVFYVTRSARHHAHKAYRARASVRDRILLCITGDPVFNLPSIRERFEKHAGWLESEALKLRFEDLVGEAGGGSDATQRDAVEKLWKFVATGQDEIPIAKLAGRIRSDASPTFRRGKTGQWRDLFDPGITDLFKEELGEFPILYGYETDRDW